MAKFGVGSLITTSTGGFATTHGLRVQPIAALLFAGSSAAANTTARFASLAMGVVATTPLEARSLAVRSEFTGTSASVRSTSIDVLPLYHLDSAGVGNNYTVGVGFTTATIETSHSPDVLSTVQPVGFTLVGGDDVQSAVAQHTLSTAVGTTQASTGYGFQPNAAFFLSHRAGAINNPSFSFGFACQDTAGTIKQWAISNFLRSTGSLFAAHKSASTDNAVQHITSGSSVVVRAAITSFKADGLELTINSTSPTEAVDVAVLGLSAPKVDAGIATITTNGVGAGVTGFTVTGLGPNVGLVCLASIRSSVDTLTANAMFSVGFASSDNSQRSVAGAVNNGSTAAAGYFNTTAVVMMMSALGILDDAGTYAQTSDGFTVTMESTGYNGNRVFWAAFANTVTDLEAHIFSSASLNAAVKEVQRIAAAITANSSLSARVREVDRISAQIASTFNIGVELEKEFETTRGFTKATAEIGARLRIFEEGEEFGSNLIAFTNTSSPDITYDLDVSTDRHRVGLAESQNARFLQILPPTTNTIPWRVAAGRTSPGVPLHPTAGVAFSVKEDAGTDVFVFTTASGETIEKVRVILR